MPAVYSICDTDPISGDYPGGAGCKDFFQQEITSPSPNGVTNAQISEPVLLDDKIALMPDTPITIKDGKLTATIKTKEGVVKQVTNAKISADGSIIEEASQISDSGMDLSNVQNARITRDETSIDSTTYATITPATSAGTTTLVNAKGVRSTRTTLKVDHADSVSVGGTTFTNVNNFTTDFVTFSLDSADTAIAETMVFNNKPFL